MSKVINTEINRPFELQEAFQRGYEQGRQDMIEDLKIKLSGVCMSDSTMTIKEVYTVLEQKNIDGKE